MTAAALRSDSGPDREGGLPVVTDTDALADGVWFTAHPERLSRSRLADHGSWIIRRRRQVTGPDIYLRAFSRQRLRHDRDSELVIAWYTATHPTWPPARVGKAARRALK
jgi:hypothetical protein